MNEKTNHNANKTRNTHLYLITGQILVLAGAGLIAVSMRPMHSQVDSTEITSIDTSEIQKEILELKQEQELLKAQLDKYQRSKTKIGFYSMQTIRNKIFGDQIQQYNNDRDALENYKNIESIRITSKEDALYREKYLIERDTQSTQEDRDRVNRKIQEAAKELTALTQSYERKKTELDERREAIYTDARNYVKKAVEEILRQNPQMSCVMCIEEGTYVNNNVGSEGATVVDVTDLMLANYL